MDSIIASCIEGLRRCEQSTVGATAPAVSFAEFVRDFVAEGWPLDDDQIASACEAHRLLDKADDMDPEAKQTCRLLWGGVDAPEAVRQFDDAHREPVRAELSVPLDKLSQRMQQLDDALRAKIEAALRSAMLAAARAIGARLAASLSKRDTPIYAEQRADLAAHKPYGTWFAVNDRARIMANVAVEDAIAAVLEDLRLSVEEALDTHAEDVIARLERDTTLSEAEIRAALEEMDGDHSQALLLVTSLFSAFVLQQFTTRTGEERPPEDAIEMLKDVPEYIVAITVAVAGGAATDGYSVARDAMGQVVDRNGQRTGGSSVAKRVLDVFAADPDVDVTVEYEWVYGDPKERFKPYIPHLRLDGTRWRMEDDAADIAIDGDSVNATYNGYYPGDHIGCRCRITSRLVRR